MHLQDPSWFVYTIFFGLPRLRCVGIVSLRTVASFVCTDGATGGANCPKAERRYIFGTEAENVGSAFGRNGSNLFVAQY